MKQCALVSNSFSLRATLGESEKCDSPFLLAISGGIDSVVLAHLLHTQGYPFAMAHCNFHLRQGECDRDELFVRRLAKQYGVPIHVAEFDTVAFAASNHLGIEDSARRLRYDYFESLLQQYRYSAILTAHHRDDSNETFFLNLIRGTGLSGLHGILPVQGHILRPLLQCSRSDIESYAAAHQLEHVEDCTNASLDYRRNRIRHQVMPLLREINTAADSTINQTILHLQSVEALYNAFVSSLRSQLLVTSPDGSALLSLSLPFPDQAHQLLFELLRPYGFNMSQVNDILSSTQSGCQFYSATHRAILDRQSLLLSPLNNQVESSGQPSSYDGLFREELITEPAELAQARANVKSLPSHVAYFDADKVVRPLTLRHWQNGDRFQPLGMARGSQLLSDYFSDHKFSLAEKERQLLLVDASGTIHWIVSRRTSHPSRITDKTTAILSVTFDSAPVK